MNYNKLSGIRYPQVSIVGRPNVGKSTLFNCLVRRHRAITHSVAGVTRDAVEEQCNIAGMPVSLIDTGGIKSDSTGPFDKIVSRRSLQTLTEATLILLVVNINEMTAEDEYIVESLRAYQNKIITVANKADTVEKEYLAHEFHRMGYGEPVAISSAHGRNIDLLSQLIRDTLQKRLGFRSSSEISSSVAEEAVEDEVHAEASLDVSLIGRPNAGKSTLANYLTGTDSSLVSDIPGTTRDTIAAMTQYGNRLIRFIDTAGIRRKAKVAENVEYYSVNRALKAVMQSDLSILLVDSNVGLTAQDKKISAQAVKKGHAMIIALSKWDEKVPEKIRLNAAIDKIRFQFPILEWAPIIPISGLEGYGIKRLFKHILAIDQQQNRRIETAEINRSLSDWIKFTPPHSYKGRRFKVLYMTQVSIKPVKFIAFVNHVDDFPDSYRRFLMNKIRQDFDFNLVPIILEIREG